MMDQLNALPQALVGFFIVWLVVTAISAIICVWKMGQIVGIVGRWYDDWLDLELEPEPEPKVDPLQAARDRMAKARAARKPRK